MIFLLLAILFFLLRFFSGLFEQQLVLLLVLPQ
jgi:hypothetical protein